MLTLRVRTELPSSHAARYPPSFALETAACSSFALDAATCRGATSSATPCASRRMPSTSPLAPAVDRRVHLAVHTLEFAVTLTGIMGLAQRRCLGLGALTLACAACGSSENGDAAVGGASGGGGDDAGVGGAWVTGGYGGSSASAGAGGSGSAALGGNAGLGGGGSAGVGGGSSGSAGVGGSGGASTWNCSGTCLGLCTNVIAAACTSSDPTLSSQTACESACQELAGKNPKECDCDWKNVLECASASSVQCPKQTCVGGVCVNEPIKFLGCETELAVYELCSTPCLREGAHVGGGLGGTGGLPGSYEQAGTQCACPDPLKPGAPPGAPCQDFSDCAEHCCDCPKDKGKYRTRLCLNGKCASATVACESPEPGICYVNP